MKTFGERLKFLREEKGLSLKQLSAKIGISDTILSMWERGVALNPTLENLIKLCKFFGEDMNYMTGWSSD